MCERCVATEAWADRFSGGMPVPKGLPKDSPGYQLVMAYVDMLMLVISQAINAKSGEYDITEDQAFWRVLSVLNILGNMMDNIRTTVHHITSHDPMSGEECGQYETGQRRGAITAEGRAVLDELERVGAVTIVEHYTMNYIVSQRGSILFTNEEDGDD